jgi:DNA invertase Pin-like site-specific DNA recombinase
MNMLLNLESPVTTAHRAKLAYIYVRQSTAGQVRQHQESTELQYRLVDRAAAFGWPKERIEVIDDDLGKSGTSSDGRGGFQRLIAEIGLGKAGLVFSLDASRLARNNHDWHQLLELCSLFGVLIADGERVYDPCAYHDRLLLGLSGIMSEAELHQIKLRLHQGERQKAARGELRLPLPAGLVHGRDGRVALNPDEEVQARLLHLFAKFRELRSAKAVMRHFQEANLLLPVRPLAGPSPHDVVWQPASNARILQVLKEPGLCRGLCLWPTPAQANRPPLWFAGMCDGSRGDTGLAGLPEGHISGIYRLGGVHGEPPAARFCQLFRRHRALPFRLRASFNLNDCCQAMGIMGRANLERQKSARLSRWNSRR